MTKKWISSTAAFALVAAVLVGGAAGNGSPFSPGLAGYEGVVAPNGGVRYTAMWTKGSTIVVAIRTEGGRVLRAQPLRGHYGVPLVAYDGTAGGLSGNAQRLVVASYGPSPGASGITRFAVLDTKGLRVRHRVALDGSWSFDAIAPDGSILYLTQHVSAGRNPVYRVRSYDVRTGLLRGAIVDRLEGEEDMGGEPVTRATSADGRWAYTLYARRKHEPFVHALDTARREAFCIDLPLELRHDDQWALRLRLREGAGRLSVRSGARVVAVVDTDSWKVETGRS
jgi:DNA-binding beta-propeller fold protein YncE